MRLVGVHVHPRGGVWIFDFHLCLAIASLIATDQLYRPLHLDRAGRGIITTELAGGDGQSVLLYNDHDKRVWLVSKFSLLLHFVRTSELLETKRAYRLPRAAGGPCLRIKSFHNQKPILQAFHKQKEY
jgi:hypothetical protein